MGKLSRDKGAAFERWVSSQFMTVFGEDACRRNLQPQGGKVVGSDVLTPLLHVECKVGKKPNPRAALQQCESDNPLPRAKYCCAVLKDNQKQPGEVTKPFVVMRLDMFLELLRRVK